MTPPTTPANSQPRTSHKRTRTSARVAVKPVEAINDDVGASSSDDDVFNARIRQKGRKL